MTTFTKKIFRWCFWNLLSRVFVFVVLKPQFRFSRTAHSAKLPRAPFIIVANHGTFFDPWLVGGYSPYPFAIMCNDDAFTGSGFSRWYLEGIGAFPKKKGASDFKAMKRTLLELKAGYPVCLFPEGQTTWDGKTQLMYKGIEKIIKKSGCPLVLVRMQGNFLSKPWWAHTQRKGKVFLTFSVLTAKELTSLSDDEVFAHIRTTLAQNDITDPDLKAASFTGINLAHGLERCVWECMKCVMHDTLVSEGNLLICKSCGYTVEVNAYCYFKNDHGIKPPFVHLGEWMSHLRNSVLCSIKNATHNTVLCRTTDVVCTVTQESGGFDTGQCGTLSLTPVELSFVVLGGSEIKILVADISLCVIQKKDICEIEVGIKKYRFSFLQKSPMKWVYYIRYLRGYEKNEVDGFL